MPLFVLLLSGLIAFWATETDFYSWRDALSSPAQASIEHLNPCRSIDWLTSFLSIRHRKSGDRGSHLI